MPLLRKASGRGMMETARIRVSDPEIVTRMRLRIVDVKADKPGFRRFLSALERLIRPSWKPWLRPVRP